ncbi:MAG: DNA methyltransferase [Candidatus Acidiferrales bacterium]
MDSDVFAILTDAALDITPVSGWTHNFYRYPARFSPRFAAAAIQCFSRPSDLVLDPYMGGGTVVVEGVAAGRRVVGNDLNSLAAFIAKVKVTSLTSAELRAIRQWAIEHIPLFSYTQPAKDLNQFVDSPKTKNLSLVRARFIKKVVAAALATIVDLPTETSRDFAKCIVLRVSQWALDGREHHTPLNDFRAKLSAVAEEMLEASRALGTILQANNSRATLLNMDASLLDRSPVFSSDGQKAALVVTSPPYPGVHVLYHRWQVDGRRETPAPYWIAGCSDGQGASFYNFADRRESAADAYFEKSLNTLKTVRRVMHDGGHIVQLLAFNRPEDQLPRYLDNMRDAGFAESRIGRSRIWRQVPNRKWHAALLGKTNSSHEVILVHRAI